MESIKAAELIQKAIVLSRLNDFGIIAIEGRQKRNAIIAQTLDVLSDGAYLIGTGPYAVGIFRLSTDEITIGRSPSPVEENGCGVVDIEVRDCVNLAPRESSRMHARILRVTEKDITHYVIEDAGSSCGTLVNGKCIGGGDCETPEKVTLIDGDNILMGPTGVNSFVFFIKGEFNG